jgi:hypothetical protein
MITDEQSKRKLSNVCTQLMLSAIVLLVPPLLTVAGVIYLDPTEGAGQKIGAERADKRPELAPSLALVSAEQRPVIVEPRSVAEAPASNTQKQIAKDSTRYIGPVTVGDGNEQLMTTDVEPPEPTAVADLFRKIPEQLPTEIRRSRTRSTDTVAAVEELQPALPPGTNESGNWVVQVSAQRTEEEARSAFRVAQSKYAVLAGYQVLIRKKDRGRHGVFYAAQVGSLSPDEANGLCSRIKNAGGKCFTQEN